MPDILIPWRGGDPHREAALDFIAERSPYPIVIGDGGEPWVKGQAVHRALERSEAEIVVLSDADVFTDGLAEAVAAVEAGASWAVPHDLVYRLSEKGTADVLAGGDWREAPLAQPPYRGLQGGGMLVARRETLAAIPIDPRFVGWGHEDEAHALALHYLLEPAWRGDAPLVHLWHPPQERENRRRGSRQNWTLYERYRTGRRDKAHLVNLVKEIHDALGADQPPVHDHEADALGHDG